MRLSDSCRHAGCVHPPTNQGNYGQFCELHGGIREENSENRAYTPSLINNQRVVPPLPNHIWQGTPNQNSNFQQQEGFPPGNQNQYQSQQQQQQQYFEDDSYFPSDLMQNNIPINNYQDTNINTNGMNQWQNTGLF